MNSNEEGWPKSFWTEWHRQGDDPNGWEYRVVINFYPQYFEILQEFKDKEVCKLTEVPAEIMQAILTMMLTFYDLMNAPKTQLPDRQWMN